MSRYLAVGSCGTTTGTGTGMSICTIYQIRSSLTVRRLLPSAGRSCQTLTVAGYQGRRRLAESLQRILEVEPFACPRCGEEMRIVAFVTQPKQIDASSHLRRTRATRQRPRAPPRRWKSAAGSTSANIDFRLPGRSPLGGCLGCPDAPITTPQAAVHPNCEANSVLFGRSRRQTKGISNSSAWALASSISEQHTCQGGEEIPIPHAGTLVLTGWSGRGRLSVESCQLTPGQPY